MQQPFASKEVFHQAIQLINTGEIQRAEAICREAIERNPADVNMLALLGALLFKTRRWDEAEGSLRKVISLAPAFAKAHEDLGRLLVELDRPDEAVPILQRAISLDPTLEAAHFNLGKGLAMLGRSVEADQALEKSLELSPVRRMIAMAVKDQQAGRLAEAERLCRDVLRDYPKNVDALRLLGVIAYNAGRPDEAERLLNRALVLAPEFTAAVIDLGRLLKEQDRYEEAIDCFRRAIALEPHNAQAHFLLAGSLAPAALTSDAVNAYRKTLAIEPRHAGAMLGLGHVLKTLGCQDEAIDAYRECIELRPDNGEVYWSLANLKTYRFTDAEIEEMKSRLDEETLGEQSEVNFLFALAKAHEDRGSYETAFRYYREGNEKQRAMVSYDPVQTEVLNDRLVEIFDAEFLRRRAGSGNLDDSAIFIMGLPRSGSTLIEQILASHSLVEGTSELPYLGRVTTSLNRNRADGVTYPEALRDLPAYDLERLGGEYLRRAALHRWEGTRFFIDKMPNNFPNIGFLHLILPNARIIDARRYPLDACLGCYRQLFARGQTFTYDLTEIGEYYLQYRRMMAHWHEVLPGRVLTVQYEDVVTDLEHQVRRLLEHCGLPWEEACLRYYETERPVRTASSEQVRQPIYSDSVGSWRRYEKHLDELLDVLNPVL